MKKKIDHYLKKLFYINRSLTGNGNRKTLKVLSEIIPIKIKEVSSGTKVYDWKIPDEWNIKDAYIKDAKGKILISFKNNNLHIIGYSKKYSGFLNWKNLKKKIITFKGDRNSIPYRTAYYNKTWGFCVSQNQYEKIKNSKEPFEVKIDSSHKKRSMTYGEYLIKGSSRKEILISSYICHPSMANDSLSGFLLSSILASKLRKTKTKWSYRFIFVPETIGAIAYCNLNENKLKQIDNALVITTVGGPGNFGYKKSWNAEDKINDAIEEVFKENKVKFITYPFDVKGSDERQYSSIGFRINSASITKDKYYEYKEYHTSKDDLKFVNSENINETLNLYLKLIKKIEKWVIYKSKNPYCEPMLSKRNLYSKIGGSYNGKQNSLDLISWILFLSDGKITTKQISNKLKVSENIIKKISKKLEKKKLLIEI